MCGDSGTYRNDAYTCIRQARTVKPTSGTSFRFAAQSPFSRPLLATQSCLCWREREPDPAERHAFSDSPAAMGARVTSSRQGDPSFWPDWREVMVGIVQPLPDLLTWRHGYLELERKAKKVSGHLANACSRHIAYWGEKQILICLSCSKCSFLLLTAKHVPNAHTHILSELGCVHLRIHHAQDKQLKHKKKNSLLWPEKRIRCRQILTYKNIHHRELFVYSKNMILNYLNCWKMEDNLRVQEEETLEIMWWHIIHPL